MAQRTKTQKSFGAITLVRHLVQIGVFCLFLTPLFLTDIEGENFFFGTLSSSRVFGVDILDPLATLEVAAAAKTLGVGMLVAALPPLLFYGIIRGRAFCGWVCPVNLLLEMVDWVRSRTPLSKIKPMKLRRHTKIWIAGGTVVLAFLTGMPIFELISPIGAISKGVVLGAFVGIWMLLAIVVMELFFAPRLWCTTLCPLGGTYEVLGNFGIVSVAIDKDKCTKCQQCKSVCLADPDILDDPIAGRTDRVVAGDCMLCGKCVERCPEGALSFKIAPPKIIGKSKKQL